MAKVRPSERAAAAAAPDAPSTPKRLRSKCDTASQAIVVDGSEPHLSLHSSPRQALAARQTIEPPTLESRLRDLQAEEAIIPPADDSKAATVATIETADVAADDAVDELLDGGFADNLDGTAWERLSRFCKPGSTSGPRTSWIFRHGYRVAVRKDMRQTWFICRYCHQHKIVHGGGPTMSVRPMTQFGQ